MLEYGVIPTFDIVFQYGAQGYIFLKRKISPYKNVWAFPGLRMLKGETLHDTLQRIAKQELGITCEPSAKVFLDQYVGRFQTEHLRQDLSTGFLIKLSGTEKLTPNPQHFSEMRITKVLPKPVGAMYEHYFQRALAYSSLHDLPLQTTGTLLAQRAKELGLTPHWETDSGLCSLTFQGKTVYFFHNLLPFNSSLSTFFSKDKPTTRAFLEKIGEKNIPYCVPHTLHQAKAFLKEHKKIILKPTRTSRSRDISLVHTAGQLSKLPWNTCILEKFIPGTEFRVLVLDKKVVGVAEKSLSPTPERPWNKHWKTFLPKNAPAQLQTRALAITYELSLRFAAVDFIVDRDNTAWVLEVNASPGFVKFHHPDEGPVIDIAGKVLSTLLSMPLPAEESLETNG